MQKLLAIFVVLRGAGENIFWVWELKLVCIVSISPELLYKLTTILVLHEHDLATGVNCN